MTVIHYGNQNYRGLSTDTKPVAASTAVNAIFEETDTGDEFRNNGTAWVKYPVASNTQSWSIYYSSGTTVEARNNKTGSVVYTNASGNVDGILDSIITNISPAGTPTVIEFNEGNFYLLTSFTDIDATRVPGNIKIKGQGPGITNILLRTGAVRGFQIEGAVAVGKTLTSTCQLATFTCTVSTGDAATFAVGDYVLLRTDYFWLTTSTTTPLQTSSASRQGEIHRIASISGGVITFEESTKDQYSTSGNAVLAKIDMLQNIILEDFTIKPIPSGYTGQTTALLWCKWIDNLQLKNLEIADSTITSSNNCTLYNCINSDIDVIVTQSGNYPFVELPTTGQYGVYVGLACEHMRIKIRSRGIWRHTITGGGINTNIANAGVPRDITVTGSAESGLSVAWDWHADGDGITFQNCNVSSLGSTVDTTHLVYGVSSRARNTSIIGCNIDMVTGIGIAVNENANRSIISGNNIRRIRPRSDAAYGMGIRINDGIIRTNITGNMIYDCTNATMGAIWGEGTNHDTVITGNSIYGCGPIRFTAATDCVMSGNRIDNGASKALVMDGACDRWVIIGNNAQGSATSTFVGANNMKLAGTNVNL